MPQDAPLDAVEKEPIDSADKETPETVDTEKAPNDDDGDREPTPYEKRLRKEAEKHRREKEELAAEIAKRDDAARKKDEAKKKEEGKYQELLAERERELAAKEEENLKLRERAAVADILEAKRRTELLEKLPKKLRDKYEAWDIEQLEDVVTDFVAESKAPGSPGVDNPTPRSSGPQEWRTMTTEERTRLLKDDPTRASQLIREDGLKNRNRYR